MRDPAYGLRERFLPRTRVRKGKEKGRGCFAPALPRYVALTFEGTMAAGS